MTAPSGTGTLLDRNGCLTAAGLAALRGAAPGRAPKEVAAHVATCARCQQRLLSGLSGPATATPVRRGSPGVRLVWMLVLVVFGMLALVTGLLAMRWLGR
jgi:hypothetical protein